MVNVNIVPSNSVDTYTIYVFGDNGNLLQTIKHINAIAYNGNQIYGLKQHA